QLVADLAIARAVVGLEGEAARLERGADTHLAQLLARTGDRVALAVEQLLDQQDHLDVALAVQALLRPRFVRRHPPELGLPVTQAVGLHARDPAHLADPVVEAIRNRPVTREVVGELGLVLHRHFRMYLRLRCSRARAPARLRPR